MSEPELITVEAGGQIFAWTNEHGVTRWIPVDPVKQAIKEQRCAARFGKFRSEGPLDGYLEMLRVGNDVDVDAALALTAEQLLEPPLLMDVGNGALPIDGSHRLYRLLLEHKEGKRPTLPYIAIVDLADLEALGLVWHDPGSPVRYRGDEPYDPAAHHAAAIEQYQRYRQGREGERDPERREQPLTDQQLADVLTALTAIGSSGPSLRDTGYMLINMLARLGPLMLAPGEPSEALRMRFICIAADAYSTFMDTGAYRLTDKVPATIEPTREPGTYRAPDRLPFDRIAELLKSWRAAARAERVIVGDGKTASMMDAMINDVAAAMEGWLPPER